MWAESYQLVQHLRRAESATISLCSRLETPQELVVVKEIHRRAGKDHVSTTGENQDAEAATEAAGDNLQQEYDVATRLQKVGGHRHVVTFDSVSFASDDQSVMLVMEYCAGGDLFSYLEKLPDRRVDERQALQFFQQIALGVQLLHLNGVAHRDLSLENVLLNDANELKICDFGLSVSVDSPCSGRVGKFNYMAPEIILGEKYCLVQAGIWSLGVILFILLTGSPLFEVAEPLDPAFEAIKHVGVIGILTHWQLEHLYSPDTVDLLSSLLQLDPQRRLASVDEIVERLDTFAQQ